MSNSKYGVKIKNIEISSLYDYKNGTRDYFLSKNAMFTNSLFLDYLLENGLNVTNGGFTQDIVCFEYNMNCKSYEEQVKIVEKSIESNLEDENFDKERDKKLNEFLNKVHSLSNNFVEISKDDIRNDSYSKPISIVYKKKNKNDEYKELKTIKYKQLYRSTGKAKNGSCMFINEKLYNKAKEFLRMGIEIPKENPPLVEIRAYEPLISSTIIDRIKIDPKNILILKDVDSFFETNVIIVETQKVKDKKKGKKKNLKEDTFHNECITRKEKNYKLKNTLFDGQGLIDKSIFPNDCDGYVLLRQHFCKMACFCTDIQLFFKDKFKDKYENAKVKDMFGNEHYVKDIKLITTDNAMKWLKFDVDYEYWCKWVNICHNNFGIVKTAHKSKLGNVQKMSYQMVNSLDCNIMENVVKESMDYVSKLKQDDKIFLEYLKLNSNFSNDYEVLIALCKQNYDFVRSKYFRDRKYEIIKQYIKNIKLGKIIQNADNLIIVGSPYAMLLHSIGENVENDNTFVKENNTIQCYTERFDNGEYLAFFRSPFNSKNNLSYLHNTYDDKFKRYFIFGKQIIAINMIHTDFQDRNNGSDQDSDAGFTTNQKDIVKHAKKCYLEYPTIVNNIPKEKNNYNDTPLDYATIDNNIANSSFVIGTSSNLAQIAQTYSYNFTDEKYQNYVCILSVLAQVAIDSAKRRFDVDLVKEINRIQKELDITKKGYPVFWKEIKKKNDKFGMVKKKKEDKTFYNEDLQCPMNYLYKLKFPSYRSKQSTLPMDYFFQKFELETNRRQSKKVEEFIQKYSINLNKYNTSSENTFDREDDYILLRSDFNDMIESIQTIYLSKTYLGLMSWLIDRAFNITNYQQAKQKLQLTNTQLDFNKAIILKTLYNINPQNLLKIFSKNT